MSSKRANYYNYIFIMARELAMSCMHMQLCMHNIMLNKNTPGEKKSEAKSEAPVSSYSYMRLKSVISG